ncbi:MAG: DinB family protein, partial [Fuerstia sp.]|nr:DinB family protein [Fuerstiella sp.]
KENTGSNNPADFLAKQGYTDLANKVHEAVIALLDAFPEKKLDDPSPEHFRGMFPTMGSMFLLIATHSMMHAGQIVPLRRELGKPVVS